jgi:hypothetical protein
VPKRSFVHGFAVRRHAVVGTTIPQSAVFVSSVGGPGNLPLANIAVPRGVTPLVSIGRDPSWRGRGALPGTVPAMPRTRLPSSPSGAVYDVVPRPDGGVQMIPRPGRVRDAGVGGPVPDPSGPVVPRSDAPESGERGGARRHALPPGYVVPYERAAPRRGSGSALPGTAPPMPATPAPSEVHRGPAGGRRHAPPPAAAPAPAPSRHSQSAPPPPAPSAGSGSAGSGESGRAVPRHGGSQSGSRSGGSGGGAPSRRRPG